MKRKNIYRILYALFIVLFYQQTMLAAWTFDASDYRGIDFPLLFVIPILLYFVAAFFTPLILGLGAFLFFKYPKQKRGDFWHYAVIYPFFAHVVLQLILMTLVGVRYFGFRGESELSNWISMKVVPLAPLFTVPFILGLGIFLIFKYRRANFSDFLHFVVIYPGFSIFGAECLFLIDYFSLGFRL